jgi:PqqA peptide cyclase
VEITGAPRAQAGLYTNLITAGVLLDAALLERLAEAGLDHVQLSVQDAEAGRRERIGGMPAPMRASSRRARCARGRAAADAERRGAPAEPAPACPR